MTTSRPEWTPMVPGRTRIHTTRSAARLLGVSVPTVQQLVESGHIAAWKTKGGHRRIPETALDAYLDRQATLRAPHAFHWATDISDHEPSAPIGEPGRDPQAAGQDEGPRQTTMVILVADRPAYVKYQRRLEEWGLPIETRHASNCYDALLEVGLHRPDIVLIDFEMPEGELDKLAAALGGRPELACARIVVCSTQVPAPSEDGPGRSRSSPRIGSGTSSSTGSGISPRTGSGISPRIGSGSNSGIDSDTNSGIGSDTNPGIGSDIGPSLIHVRKSLSQRALRNYLQACHAAREQARTPAWRE